MDNKQLAEIARILSVSEDSISLMDDEIKGSMQSVFESVSIQNDEDKKALYYALDTLWQKGTILLALHGVAKATGIPHTTLKNLDYETQQTLVYEFMMDSSQIDRFYSLTNKALAVIELEKVSKLLSIPVRELRALPLNVQERICGAYTMEYDKDSTNTELIDELRELVANA